MDYNTPKTSDTTPEQRGGDWQVSDEDLSPTTPPDIMVTKGDKMNETNRYTAIDPERAKLATPYDYPVTVDGKIMNVNIQGPEDAKKTVVILPGRGVTAPSLEYAPLIAQLKGERRVVTIDYFGSGLSDMTDKPRGSENISEEVHKALAQLGITQYTLVAHSIAGDYGLEYADKFKGEVHALVGIDTHVPNMDEDYTDPEKLKKTETHDDPSKPHDVRKDVEDVEGYEYTDDEIRIMQALYDRNRHNDSVFSAAKKARDDALVASGEPKGRHEKKSFPDSIPTVFFLSKDSTEGGDEVRADGVKPGWYECIHEAQKTDAPGSRVEVLEGQHFLHHTQSKAIANTILGL
jgi:pimeloyl-ACP methyl ester carboxylesterase